MANSSMRWAPILLACLTISIGQFSMGLVFPSLPWIAEDFSVSVDSAQWLISAYLLGFGPSQFFYGPISDSLGRRRILLSGLVLAILGLVLLLTLSHSFVGLVIGRFVQGLGTGCCAVLARASTRDQFSGEQLPQALSYITIVASFSPIIAPVIGGFINHEWGWMAVFVSLLTYISIIWLLLWWKFNETLSEFRPIPSVKTISQQYYSLLKSRYFISFASISWLNFTLVVTTISLMPFIMQVQIGMSSAQYALWALIPAFGLMSGSFLVNRLVRRVGFRPLLTLSPCMQLIGAMWLFFSPPQPLLMMIGQFFMVFGNGLALPCSQTMLMAPFKRHAGSVAALSGGGQMIISALLSMLLLHIGVTSAHELAMVIALFAAITMVNVYRGFNTPTPSDALMPAPRQP